MIERLNSALDVGDSAVAQELANEFDALESVVQCPVDVEPEVVPVDGSLDLIADGEVVDMDVAEEVSEMKMLLTHGVRDGNHRLRIARSPTCFSPPHRRTPESFHAVRNEHDD